MALGSVIDNAVIRITLAGIDKAFSQLKTLSANVSQIKGQLQLASNIGAAGFNQTKSTLTQLLSAADPVRFAIFQQKLLILSMEIGRTFIPMLIAATQQVDRLIQYFHNLTPEQREQILHWTKIALMVFGASAAISTLLPLISQAISVGRALFVVMRLLGATPLGALLTLAAVLTEVVMQGGGVGSLVGTLGTVFQNLEPVLSAVGDAFLKLFDAAKPLIVALVDGFLKVAGPLLELFATSLNALIPVFNILVGLASSFIGTLAEGLTDIVKGAVDVLVGVLEDMIQFIRDMVAEINDFLNNTWAGRRVKNNLMGGNDLGNPFANMGEREAKGAGDFHEALKRKQGGGDGDQFTPMAPIQRPQFLAIADVFKRAQESAIPDPTKLYQQAMLQNAKSQDEKLGKIVENTGKGSPSEYNF